MVKKANTYRDKVLSATTLAIKSYKKHYGALCLLPKEDEDRLIEWVTDVVTEVLDE